MSKLKKILITIASTLGILLVLFSILLYFLFRNGCGNEVFNEIKSPNGELKAVVFQRDCGATTGFSTQISIIKANSSLSNDKDNILIMDQHPNVNPIKITWQSSTDLNIDIQSKNTVYLQESSWGYFKKVHIKYVQ